MIVSGGLMIYVLALKNTRKVHLLLEEVGGGWGVEEDEQQ